MKILGTLSLRQTAKIQVTILGIQREIWADFPIDFPLALKEGTSYFRNRSDRTPELTYVSHLNLAGVFFT